MNAGMPFIVRPLIPSRPRLRFIDDAPDGMGGDDTPPVEDTGIEPVIDHAAMVDSANAKIAELTTALATALADLQATKAANWDLSQLVGTGDSEPTSDAGELEDGAVEDGDVDGENISIDDLFGAAN